MTKKIEIKTRLIALEKNQTNLYHELNNRGYKLGSINQLYQYTGEIIKTPKAQNVLAEIFKILNEWEAMKK